MEPASNAVQGGVHAEQEPKLLGTTENELGIRKWIEEQGHTLVTTSDKEGENSKFDQELVDAEVIITTPYVEATPHPGELMPRNPDDAPHLPCNIYIGMKYEADAKHETVSTPAI